MINPIDSDRYGSENDKKLWTTKVLYEALRHSGQQEVKPTVVVYSNWPNDRTLIVSNQEIMLIQINVS